MIQRRAAIDIGTVSTRLLVADVEGEQLDEVVRHTCITHLGEGLSATGKLSPQGCDRVAEVIAGFLAECRELGVERYTAFATSAMRDASDGLEFVERLKELGLEPEIISGSREALLSFRGATWGLCSDELMLVIDLGGGSTELIAGTACPADEDETPDVDVEIARSIDCGSRRVTDMFLKSDPPTEVEMDQAREWVSAQFRSYFDTLRERPRIAFALAGTATTLSAIRQGLVDYDPLQVHGSTLSGADLADLREELAAKTVEERRAVPGLDPGRAHVIVAGAMILETVLAMSGLDAVVVSEHDILYGMVLEGA
jgi:exopolyphosphatase/guanosine-5'-triphosphate,3'-diphosphate pyrophosphatase